MHKFADINYEVFFTLKFERTDKFAFEINICIFVIKKRVKMKIFNNLNKNHALSLKEICEIQKYIS
jgi:hypothetical protein